MVARAFEIGITLLIYTPGAGPPSPGDEPTGRYGAPASGRLLEQRRSWIRRNLSQQDGFAPILRRLRAGSLGKGGRANGPFS
jgi:hypothetical protein